MTLSIQIDCLGVPFVQLGAHRVRLECEEFDDEEIRQRAHDELRETPDNVRAGLKDLRELISSEPGLYVPLDDDAFLIKFLRPCKFYARSAFEKICRFYKFKLEHPAACEGLVPSRLRGPFERGIIALQGPRDQHGRRIMLVESGEKWIPRDVSLQELFRGVQMALLAAMAEPRTQVCGVVVLLDMRGLGLTHVMQFTPSFAKMTAHWIQECIPIRLKAVHILNQPYVFNMLFAIFKPFLSPKLRARIHFHGACAGAGGPSLRAHVSACALRERHGGDLRDHELPGELLWEMLAHYEDQLQLAAGFGYTKKEQIK